VSNPSKKKGTWFEVWLRDQVLRPLFGPDVERVDEVERYSRDRKGDFTGVPFEIEAKSTQRPSFQQWARKMEHKCGKAWVIVWKGDRRVKTGTGPYAVMPIELFEFILEEGERVKEVLGDPIGDS
jgi:hypothetical protein